MDINALGVDLSALAHDEAVYPPVVPGRVVHIDADFLAYHVSYEKPDDPKTKEDMQHNAETAVEHLRKSAAAEKVELHLTPFTSNKGGRFEHAIQRVYQGNRTSDNKPRMLHVMRQWLAQRYSGHLWEHCEADDGMASAQYAAIRTGTENLSIIASKDKDLNMVPGLHLDWDTGEIISVDTFGWVELRRTQSAGGSKSTKLVGYGQKWFWAQMLIGDTADNIQGLPKVVGPILNAVDPTAAVEKALADMREYPSGDRRHDKARKVLDSRPPKACGPALAIKILDRVHSNKVAFGAVRSLYERYGDTVGFVSHEGHPVPWQKVFISEAKLLWMRRDTRDENDVLKWIGEVHEAD
ncbi:hypothetical protein [Stappia phage SI01]|uniref:Exonuclease n=1 Tax=Stappia phage SI01 TaxID=2847766 RepID=A0AAE7SN67_9CAUD|nr:hypothetical protein [Stappia phage SI01]